MAYCIAYWTPDQPLRRPLCYISATNGKGGDMLLSIGSGTTFNGGDIIVSAGETTANTKTGGSIDITRKSKIFFSKCKINKQ